MNLKPSNIIILLMWTLCCNLPSLYAESLLEQYQMPPLARVPHTEPAKAWLENARVFKRAQTVSILFTAIEDPKTYQKDLRTQIQASLPNWVQDTPSIDFTGNKLFVLICILKYFQR